MRDDSDQPDCDDIGAAAGPEKLRELPNFVFDPASGCSVAAWIAAFPKRGESAVCVLVVLRLLGFHAGGSGGWSVSGIATVFAQSAEQPNNFGIADGILRFACGVDLVGIRNVARHRLFHYGVLAFPWKGRRPLPHLAEGKHLERARACDERGLKLSWGGRCINLLNHMVEWVYGKRLFENTRPILGTCGSRCAV